MLDWFIAISGEVLLVYFWAFSILAIFIGRWLMIRADGSKHFPMPSPTQLNAYEIAALREERKGIIHTALFNLWNTKLIEISAEKRKSISFSLKTAKLINISGENRGAEIKITSSNNLAPKNTFEAILYRFIAEQPRKPKEFFYQDSFHQQMDTALETTYQKLEKIHLRRTTEQLENMKKIPKIVLWLILGMVGAVFVLPFFGIIPLVNDLAVLIIYSLIPLYIILKITFFTMYSRMSVLGKRHLKELKTYFEWAKTEEHKDFDPALRVAIFGISGLIGFEMFSVFQETFIYGSASYNDSSGGGCGGGCSGGSDGSSGGCGGCGGGGGGD
jgi:uncharacterized protein (TIGR04222 family)